MFDNRMVDFGDVAIRCDRINGMTRGVDGTRIDTGYARDAEQTTSMPYRDALKLYEEARAESFAEYRAYMLDLAKIQKVV